MSGLVKAKKYDWKDSNLALFGSDTEKQVKKESAESEPAWEGAGQEVGLQIWRIVQFEVTNLDKEDYGSFFNGDSYIVLNTYKNEDEDKLEYDVHFWIGKHSTQDEYGTAAYKTVELDTLLDDRAVQHREVENNESSLFKSYFDELTIMEGGAASGFRHVEPTEYVPRFFKCSSGEGKGVVVKEKPRARSLLTSGDVFIIDKGMTIYQYNGSESSGMERFKAAAYVQKLEEARPGVHTEVLEEADVPDSHDLFTVLTEEEADDDSEAQSDEPVKLLRVSNADGSLDLEEVKTGEVTMDDLVSDDVFLVDSGAHLFVWVGGGASVEERRNGLPYAMNYLNKTEFPTKPVSVISENRPTDAFKAVFE